MPIIGFAELLTEENAGKLNKKQKQQVDHILRAARKLRSLIDDLLITSKREFGHYNLHLESFGAQKAIREVLADATSVGAKPMARANKIRITNLIDSKTLSSIRTSRS
jgi:signal transduction histidine kinase